MAMWCPDCGTEHRAGFHLCVAYPHEQPEAIEEESAEESEWRVGRGIGPR
jgi:hypothetical protein